MFPIPSSYTTIKMVGIDPGLNNIGVSIADIDAVNLKITSVTALTLKEERVLSDVCLNPDQVGDKMFKRERMVRALLTIIKEENPDIVVFETPFFDRFRPGSYAILVEVVTDFLRLILEYNNNISISGVEPLAIKHTMGVAGKKGKEVVREAIQTFPEIMDALDVPLDKLDDHAIDAISAVYTYLNRKLKPGGRKK